MLRTAASKVMWVGRATIFLVGLVVILALVLGVATTALGADGKSFLLGRTNLATAVTTLVKQGVGPALSLKVDSGPPLAVNSSAKVSGLNADTVDGKDSTDFAPNQVEPWHEVGAAGEPAFEGSWINATGDFRDEPSFSSGGTFKHNTVGFYKDPFGVVHLKGSAHRQNSYVDPIIFTLPAGYRPAAVEVQGLDSSPFLNVRIFPNGRVALSAHSDAQAAHLDGVTFRAAN